MQSFKFSLEALLNFRKMRKEQVQIIFWQATNQYSIEKEKLAGMKGKLLENLSLLRTLQQQPLSIEIFQSFQYYFDKIEKDISKQRECVMRAEEYRQQCLHNLEEAVKNHKLVEKFREKKFQNYQVEVIKEEQKMLDEIGLQLYVREK